MASGLTGGELMASLKDVFEQLNPRTAQVLKNRIAKEEYFLGQAAHDPNLYKNCHEARQAKKASSNQPFLILTYKTPVCASCGYNRKGNCALMGGKLIESPQETPEVAVQRTADILSTEGQVNQVYASRVASHQALPLLKLQALHKKRLASSKNTNSTDTQDQVRSRRVAAILNPSDPVEVKSKNLRGPSARKASNIEGFQIEVEETTGRTASSQKSLGDVFRGSALTVRAKPTPGRQISPLASIDPCPTTNSLSREAKRDNLDLNEENANQAQSSLYRLILQASRRLASGQMTTTLATQLINRIESFEEIGARHNKRTAAIKSQLSALSGGLEL
jgi:hypothetical protein